MTTNGKVKSDFDKYVIYNGKLVSKDHPSMKYRIRWDRVAILALALCLLGYALFITVSA